MSTLHDIERVIVLFSREELAQLEWFVRRMRLQKTRSEGHIALDLPPLKLGRMLEPLGTRDQSYDEMLENRM